MFALVESEAVRQLSGARGELVAFADLPDYFVRVQPSIDLRGSPGAPPPGPKKDGSSSVRRKHLAPSRTHQVAPASARVEPDGDVGSNADWDSIGTEVPDDYCPFGDSYDEEAED